MRTVDEIISGNQPRPVIIAHRGASRYFHENTMESFEAAIDMRADMIELDVRRTADGVLVVHHDHDFAGAKIMDMTRDELQDKSGSAGYMVPTLQEVLEFCAGKIPLDIELKEAGCEEQVLETVLGVLGPDSFIITSSLDTVIRKIRVLDPAIRTGLIIGDRPPWQLFTKLFPGRRVRRSGADVLVVSRKLVQLGFLKTTRKLGLPVWVYTVNDRKELWKTITDERVGGIFSDRPDVALFLRDLHSVHKASIPEEKGEWGRMKAE
ncbi:MAG: glycerophosphodiester phosphodiesterase [bacterium]|nr:glycerophosphodiester phosphodiesterase [bacterium]